MPVIFGRAKSPISASSSQVNHGSYSNIQYVYTLSVVDISSWFSLIRFRQNSLANPTRSRGLRHYYEPDAPRRATCLSSYFPCILRSPRYPADFPGDVDAASPHCNETMYRLLQATLSFRALHFAVATTATRPSVSAVSSLYYNTHSFPPSSSVAHHTAGPQASSLSFNSIAWASAAAFDLLARRFWYTLSRSLFFRGYEKTSALFGG